MENSSRKEDEGNITKHTFLEKFLDNSDEKSTVDVITSLLQKGGGETFLTIGKSDVEENFGLSDEQLSRSLENLSKAVKKVNAEMKVLRVIDNKSKKQADILIRSVFEPTEFIEVRVAVIGNVDSGKSTLLGVITHGVLDDGRGTARLKLFRHKHEIDSGRTSSIGNEILGFDLLGDVVNKPDNRGVIQTWSEICKKSAKIITFIDLAGHEKYLKTTVFGLTGCAPNYCMLIIGANMGIVGMTKEHLGLALAICVPVFIIITKIDICPENILSQNIKLLKKLLKSPGCRKLPLFVNNLDDVLNAAVNFTSDRICPVFQLSNVTGSNLDLLKAFLHLLPVRQIGSIENPVEYQIDELYNVPGVGTVVSGTTINGVIKLNANLFIGPDFNGNYRSVQVKGIHRKRMPVDYCSSGQTASLLLRKVKRSDIRKGMVILDSHIVCHREFIGDVLILHHPTTISVKYQAMIHVNSIRQTATIVSMSTAHMRTGDRASVRFRFINHPEYLKVNQRFVFREGRTKAVGTITEVFEEKQEKTKASEFAVLKKHTNRKIDRRI